MEHIKFLLYIKYKVIKYIIEHINNNFTEDTLNIVLKNLH